GGERRRARGAVTLPIVSASESRFRRLGAVVFDTVLIAARVMDPPRVASRLERAGAVSAYLREGGVIGRIGSLKVRQDEDLFRLRGSLTQFTGSTASSPTVVEEARGRLEELFGEHLEVA